MYLNLYFMQDDLDELRFSGTMVDRPQLAACARPVICDALPGRLDPSALYIVESGALPARHEVLEGGRKLAGADGGPSPSILCLGQPPEAWLSTHANVLYTTEPVSLAALANAVIGEFARYDAWERSLQEVIDKRLPVGELAARSLGVFGNPIYGQSSSYQIIFFAMPRHGADEPLFKRYVEEIYEPTMQAGGFSLTDEAIEMMTGDPEYVHAVEAVEPAIYSGDPFGFRTLFYNCRIDGASIARVTIDEIARPLKNRDFALVAVLGDFLTKARAFSDVNLLNLPQDYDAIIQKLLAHKLVPMGRLAKLLETLDWGEFDEYLVMTLQGNVIDANRVEMLPQLSLSLARSHGYMRFTLFEGRSVFICNLTKGRLSRHDAISELTPTLRDLIVKATFSTSFSDFKDLYYYYRQALDTERVGMRTNPMFWIFRYEDYAIRCMVDRCLTKTIPRAIFPPGLVDLIAHDESKGTGYVQLLRTYLDNDRNIARTTRAAFMHRNTFLYQIERIKEILKMDLDDPDSRLELQIALRAHERDTTGARG